MNSSNRKKYFGEEVKGNCGEGEERGNKKFARNKLLDLYFLSNAKTR